MRVAWRALIAGALLAGLGYALLRAWPIAAEVKLSAPSPGDPDRGAYVARLAGCIACHSDAKGGGALLAGGPPLETPFGTFHAPNITPDPEHGIGAWSLDDFAAALRHGVAPAGTPYYPAFPYTFYARMSDQDVADLWAAIWTVPPVSRPSKPHDLVFPLNRREGLKLWRALYFEPGSFVADPTRSEAWNRGAYIVNGPGHCGACHTPRNALGARSAEEALHGASNLPGGAKSEPITPEALARKGWSRNDIVFALRYGLTPEGDSLGGSMGEVVRDGTAFLSDADLTAIATYLLPDEAPGEE